MPREGNVPPPMRDPARAPEGRPMPPGPPRPPGRGQPGRMVWIPEPVPGPGPEPASPPRRPEARRADPAVCFMLGCLAGAVGSLVVTVLMFTALGVPL